MSVQSEIDILIKAQDQASGTIAQIASTTEMSTKQMVQSFSNVATAAFNLYNSYDRIHDSEVALDRANVTMKASLNALEDSQKKLNVAIAKYGEDSPQATEAAKDLALAQDRLKVATERAELAQNNINSTMMTAALQTIPTLTTMVGGLEKLLGDGGLSGALSKVGGHLTEAIGGLGGLNLSSIAAAGGVALGAAAIGACAVSLGQWVTESEEARHAQVALDSENIQLRQAFMNSANSMDQMNDSGVNLGVVLDNLKTVSKKASDEIKVLSDATSNADNAMKVAAGGLGILNGQMGASDKITGSLAEQNKRLTDNIGYLKDRLDEATQTYENMVVQYGLGSKQAEAALNALGSAQYSYISAQKQMDDSTKATTKSIKDQADAAAAQAQALRDAGRAAFEQQQMIENTTREALQAQKDLAESNAMIEAKTAYQGSFLLAAGGPRYAYLGGLKPEALAMFKEMYPDVLSAASMPAGTGEATSEQFGGEGLVTKPTLFLAGEAGPEYFSFVPMAKGGGGAAGGMTINGPLVVIEGSADRSTAELAARLVEDKLRGVVFEASSASAPATSKRIRFGSTINAGV